jgi:beta-lactamase regulating signal transducer with metallopeptidase domain
MSVWTHVAGWVLLHFVWQGSVVALSLAGACRVWRDGSAHARYLAGCLALAVMVAAPLGTAFVLATRADAPAASVVMRDGSPRGGGVDATAGHVDAWAGPRIKVPERYFPVVVASWLAGVLVLLLRAGGSWYEVHRLRRLARSFAPSPWQASAERLAGRLALNASVWVSELSAVDVPTVLGWLRPVILLPVSAIAQLPAAQVEAILAHELAHIRRHDYLVNLVQAVVEAVLFYHPAVWWVSARIREEREQCCDEIVVALSGRRDEYAEALAALEQRRAGHRVLAPAATDGQLLRRIKRILQMPATDDVSSPPWAPTLALAAAFVLVLGGPQRSPALLAQAGGTLASALVPGFSSRWNSLAHRGSIESAGTIQFAEDLSDVHGVSDGGFLRMQVDGILSSRRVEISGSGGAVHRRYVVDGSERPWNDEGAAWLADNLPFLVRRSGIAAEARVRQIAAARGVDGVLDEVERLSSDSVRGTYLRALLVTTPMEASSSSAALTVAGDRISSSAELAQTLRAAVAAHVPAGDGFFHALSRIDSSMEKRGVLVALLEARALDPESQRRLLAATRGIESAGERAAVLNAYLDHCRPALPEVRDAFLRSVETIESSAEQAPLRARLAAPSR